jgi:hypothetical protein
MSAHYSPRRMTLPLDANRNLQNVSTSQYSRSSKKDPVKLSMRAFLARKVGANHMKCEMQPESRCKRYITFWQKELVGHTQNNSCLQKWKNNNRL